VLLRRKHEVAGLRSDFNRLAVAVGGCHALQTLLGDSSLAKEARDLAKSLHSDWEPERDKLLNRWQPQRLPRAELTKYDVLSKVVVQASRAGFSTEWPALDLEPEKPEPAVTPTQKEKCSLPTQTALRSARKDPKPKSLPEPDSDFFSMDFASEGIEKEVMFRLKGRWERTQKKASPMQPLSARLPPSVTPTSGAPTPQSARELRIPHWTVEDSTPTCAGLFRGRGHRRGANSVSGMSGRSDLISALSSHDAISRGASPRWDSSPPHMASEIKLPLIPSDSKRHGVESKEWAHDLRLLR